MRKMVIPIALLLASACGSGATDFGTGTVTPPPPPPGDSNFVNVSITDNAFSPANASVRVNRAVRWTNNGTQAHTVTATDASFSSGNILPGGTFQRSFVAQGTFSYTCTLHGESGTVSASP
jgi:plastocyanin